MAWSEKDLEWRGTDLVTADGHIVGQIWLREGIWFAAIRFNAGHGRVSDVPGEADAKAWVIGQLDKESVWP